MSKATEKPWYTRSSSRTPRRAFSLRKKWQMLAWVTAMPLGLPVEPLV